MRKIRKREAEFNQERIEMTEKDYWLEMLYAQNIQINKLERIRSNTSTIVWIIAIIIVLSIITTFLTIRP